MHVRFLFLLVVTFGAASPLMGTECPVGDDARGASALLLSGGSQKYLQGGDPFVLADVSGTAYVFTTNRRGANVPVYRSRDNGPWTPLGDALPTLPTWAGRGHTWAPEVMRLGEAKYVLWYTAQERASGKQCIGRAQAERPEGPYTDTSSAPFLCDSRRERTIDPSPFRDDDGRLYLLWKTRETLPDGMKTAIWLAALEPDGTLAGSGGTLLVTNSEAWEGRHVEAPTLLKRDGHYYLFYSAGASTPRGYLVSWAVASRVEGPYGKSGQVLLGGSRCMKGAGHQSVVGDAKRGYQVYYHAVHPERRALPGEHSRFVDVAQLCFSRGIPVVQGAVCPP